MENLIVKEITKLQYEDFILNKHYAQRMPSVSFAYGLFELDKLIGILTIGKPASPFLCTGICGVEYRSKVYELNRLCLDKSYDDNRLSWFVSKVLKSLCHLNLILVSYADTGANHNGYIYQATNWIYTGKTKERTDKYTENGKHSRHYKNVSTKYRKIRTAKHRYVYFCANKKNKKIYLNALNYEILPYPKETNINYVLGEKIKEKIIDTETNKIIER